MSQANEAEQFMLDLINAERAAVGLDAVILDTRLNDSSEDHSSWMLDTSTFAHQGAGGSSAGDRMSAADFDFSGSSGWGENIAWQSARGEPGILDDVTALHQGLMNSPGHRANILKRFQILLNQKGFTAGVFSDSSCSGGSVHAQPAFRRYSCPF